MQEFQNLKRITYQKLASLSDEEIEKLKVDIIIVDEFHHCGAPEWGKGVERLMHNNPNAKILGLSATPIRYNDGLRDMADEMFENDVAFEMTLEEAIERGILPEPIYVSALYGYEQELEKMQADIARMKDEVENKKQAQKLLNKLREKLDENSIKFPELLSKYMKNKNGKFIIFCRSIKDMNEKIKKAQEMFGGVNSKITVRAVSSKIRESEKILTEFEQDNNEDTLKLLYSVDMINEGYSVKGLDGIVMMRPTYSPTVFTQQLGRGLTVGDSKNPVIIDLVNNFDTCKIIEDLAERMKQYKDKNIEGLNGKSEKRSRIINIFDNTKEFRLIAEKITGLLNRKKVLLEDKIIELINKGNFTENEKQVLSMHYGINGEEKISQTQIAKKIGISKERVRQILLKAKRKIIYPTDTRIQQLDLENRVFDIDYDLQKKIIEEYFNIFDVFISNEPNVINEDDKNKLRNMLLDGIEKTKKRKKQVETIERMSKEQKIEILKAKFGEKINSSDFSIIQKWDKNYKFFSNLVINEDLLDYYDDLFDLYKECLNSEFVCEKIRGFIKEDILRKIKNWVFHKSTNPVAEMKIEELEFSLRTYNCLKRYGINRVQDLIGMSEDNFIKIRNFGRKSANEVIDKLETLGIELVNSKFEFVNKGLSENDSKKQNNNINEIIKIDIVREINSSEILSEGEKENLIKKVNEKRMQLEEERLCSEIIDAVKYNEILEMSINELDLSNRSCFVLVRARINKVLDLLGKSEGELIQIRNLGRGFLDEIIEKMKSLGIEMVDGHFVNQNLKIDIKRMRELEEKINSNLYISEEKKEELRKLLYETFKIEKDNNLEDSKESGASEELSKDEHVRYVLKLQKTIKSQENIIMGLSSPKKEDIDG